MKSLNELLDMARRHADLTGDGTETLAAVTTAEAHVAAWHATLVQGGVTDPVVEAWRLSVDRGLADRHALSDKAFMDSQPGPRQVDVELVGRCIGAAEIAAGIAAAFGRYAPPVEPFQPMPEPAAPATNDRGEFTSEDGQLHHVASPTAGEFVPPVVHEGAWISCDGCNPVVVIAPQDAELLQPESAALIELRARYADAKAARDTADEEFATAKGKLQAALAEASGGALRATLVVPGYKPMTLTYTEPWRIDSKRLKAEQPVIYATYATQGKQWTLAESRSKS